MTVKLTDKQKALYANTFGVLTFIDNKESLDFFMSLCPTRVVDVYTYAIKNGIVDDIQPNHTELVMRASLTVNNPSEDTIRTVLMAYEARGRIDQTLFMSSKVINGVFLPDFSDETVSSILDVVLDVYSESFEGRKYIGANIANEPFRAMTLYFDNWEELVDTMKQPTLVVSKARINELTELGAIKSMIKKATQSCSEVVTRNMVVDNPDDIENDINWNSISPRLFPIFDPERVLMNAPVKEVGQYLITNNIKISADIALGFLARIRKLKPTSVDKYYEIISKLINIISKEGRMAEVENLTAFQESLEKHALDYFRKSHQLKYPSAHMHIKGEVTEEDLPRHWELVIADALEQLIESNILGRDVLYELVSHMMAGSSQFEAFVNHFEDRYSNITFTASMRKLEGG